jgi:hypothetical protein
MYANGFKAALPFSIYSSVFHIALDYEEKLPWFDKTKIITSKTKFKCGKRTNKSYAAM